jgi:hypothetical protein
MTEEQITRIIYTTAGEEYDYEWTATTEEPRAARVNGRYESFLRRVRLTNTPYRVNYQIDRYKSSMFNIVIDEEQFAEQVEKGWLSPCDKPDGVEPMEKALFEIEDHVGPFEGYHLPGNRWNGWAVPYFTEEQARVVMETFNRITEPEFSQLSYDEAEDCYREHDEAYDDPADYPARQIWVDGEQVKVYSIGGACWVWSETDEPQQREDGAWEMPLNADTPQKVVGTFREDFWIKNPTPRQGKGFCTLHEAGTAAEGKTCPICGQDLVQLFKNEHGGALAVHGFTQQDMGDGEVVTIKDAHYVKAL